MKKLLSLLFFTILLFYSATLSVSAQTFQCNCITAPGGGCIWEPDASASCPVGYGATAAACAASTNIECLSNASTCIADCVENPIPYGYGSNCNPNSAQVDCQPDPNDPTAPVSCRFSPEINYGRCLKNPSALNSGTPCRDNTECAGSSEGSLCVFLPGVATQRACITQVEMDTQGLNCQTVSGGSVVCEEGYTPPPPPEEPATPNCDREGKDGIQSAIGCIPYETIFLAARSNAFLIGLAGSIALILLARAAFMYMTSQGDAGKLSEAKETITAVIAGLIMLAFTTLVFRFIAQSILGLF